MRLRRTPVTSMARVAAICLTAAALAGCGSDDKPPTQPGGDPEVAGYVAAVATGNLQVQAERRSGQPPAAQAGAPAVQANLTATILRGGTSLVTLSAPATFSRVIVAVANVDGYYELTLPSAVTSTSIAVTAPQDVRATNFTLRMAAASAGGQVGTYDDVPVTIPEHGTGDIQVTVSWNAPSDVDLHVVDATGQEVYYGNPEVASGGVLDIDSNAGCNIDNVNNENITWPTGRAPRGTYTVRVDYWDSCDVSATDYVVTVRVRGQQPRIFTGRFTGTGNHGGQGAGVTITTFTY
jgi:hypothetical protein